MSYLLFPGRHLVNTRFQEHYLSAVLRRVPQVWERLQRGTTVPTEPITKVIFAITSSNQENSRFNPIPFYIRAIGVDRFARSLQSQVPFGYRIFGIPHYGHTEKFAAFTIKEIVEQSERAIVLTPKNTVVLCSTPEVSKLYVESGFSILPGESSTEGATCPIDLVRQLGGESEDWSGNAMLQQNLSEATTSLFRDFPEVPKRVRRMYRDPLTTQEGSLTIKRNYNTYARGMNEIVRLKYLDIQSAIKAGRIVDEGCADGALLAEISQDFQDSDLFGVDIAAEFAHRFHERQRAGDFSGAYVHFFLRNLLDCLFEPGTIDTTICNSTLHELWSYAEQEKTVRSYLAEKYRQLRPGGRLVIRDVTGPDAGDTEVFLSCSENDGINLTDDELASHTERSPEWLASLSTYSRFLVFVRDYLRKKHTTAPTIHFRESSIGERRGFILSRRNAAEFLSKKDYTDNWASEMNEEFCFWSFEEWKQVLTDTGFNVLENPNDLTSGSRVYTNPWIVKNRYEKHAALYDIQSGERIPYPPTNMILVAEKPILV